MSHNPPARQIDAIRRFNRFYTRQIGLLHERRLYHPYSLTEARVLYELAHRTAPTASALVQDLDLDPGYLSRMLRRFVRQGIAARTSAPKDGRSSLLSLSARGRTAFGKLDAGSRSSVGKMLTGLHERDRERLLAAMDAISSILEPPARGSVPLVLRPHRPGDMGWVVSVHGELYAREYGWDETFEALVAEIAAKFIRDFDPKQERCWIAELDGQRVGSVFLVKHTPDVAKLRLLIVDPKARGMGVGRKLVDECIAYARSCGYRRLALWTNSVLTAARQIYRQTGFERVGQEPHHSFGQDLVSEDWELSLD